MAPERTRLTSTGSSNRPTRRSREWMAPRNRSSSSSMRALNDTAPSGGIGLLEGYLPGIEIPHADNGRNGSRPVYEHPLHHIGLNGLHLRSQISTHRRYLPAQ